MSLAAGLAERTDFVIDALPVAGECFRAVDDDIDFGRPTADAVIAEMKRFRKAVIEKI